MMHSSLELKNRREQQGYCMVIDDLAKVAEIVRCKGFLKTNKLLKKELYQNLLIIIMIIVVLEKGNYFLMAHTVQNGIKQALRINKYMLVESMAKKFGLTLLMKFQLLCSHQENSP